MSRPPSAASASTNATALPSPATSGHKRTASQKSFTTSLGPCNASLFLTNLRLLNLDQHPSWPAHFTATTLTNPKADTRHRIRCLESALYHLFRLFDAETCRDKLQPFFPPLEPLQSLNLRAALYRCLNELKKSGVLGREAVLRKSMLDECAGEKLWEVCVGFSAVVVRKVEARGEGRPVADRVGRKTVLGKREGENLLPLAIAHRASLSARLREKECKGARFGRLWEGLDEKREEVKRRTRDAQEAAQQRKGRKQGANVQKVERQLQDNWIGNTALRDALLHGDHAPSDDTLVNQPFEQIWRRSEEDQPLYSVDTPSGLLEILETRVQEQKARLRRWQGFQEKLQAAKLTHSSVVEASMADKTKKLRFGRHQNIHPSKPEVAPSAQERPLSSAFARYDEILTTMREQLRNAASSRRRVMQGNARRPSMALDTTAGAMPPVSHEPMSARPAASRRTLSRSKTWQRPQVLGQREPRPLKCEVFSPLKSQRLSISSVASPGTPPSFGSDASAQRRHSSLGSIDSIAEAVNGVLLAERVQQSSRRSSRSDAPPRSVPESSSSGSTERRPSPQHESPPTLRRRPTFKLPINPSPQPHPTHPAPPSPPVPRPSLAERTRKSMAHPSSSHGDKPHPLLPRPDAPQTATPPSKHDSVLSDPSPARTRPSISQHAHAPDLQPARPTPHSTTTHTRARSSISPIKPASPLPNLRRSSVGKLPDAFAVPGGTTRGAVAKGGGRGRRDVTPREELFARDAGYESVFKSRPRVALSPVLSPLGLGGEGARGDVGSSPLVR